MESEWTYTSIDELKADSKGSIAIGPFGSRMKSDCYVESGIPVIRGTNITGGPDFEGEFVYITEEKADTLGSSNVYQGDLVFPHRGAIGEVGILQEDKRFVLSSSLMKLTCDEQKAYPKFLYYFFKSHLGKHELLKNASQVGTPGIGQPLTSLKAIELSIPPLPEQKAIAHILGTLDDKIELNRKMNATLEAMAQALFKSWFVDFDPVIDNALAAGKPIPEALAVRAEIRRQALADGTANREAAKAFPDSFQETEELGWIPEGWETGIITDLADLNSQSWSNKRHPDRVNYVDLANTKNGRINEVFPYDYSEAPSRARRVLKVDDTIIGTVRPGNRSFAYIHEDGLTGSTGFAVLRPKQEACRSYVYLCLTQDDVIDHFAHLADGGAYPAIRPEVVGNIETVTFPQELMELFDQKAYPLIEKIGQHQRATDTLTKLRDTLLPKLISGELLVSEAEQRTEEALV